MIRILLTTMMLACPLLCRSGSCVLADDCCARESERVACCDDDHCAQHLSHNEQPHENHSDGAPSDSVPSGSVPCGQCQCICGGAVIVQQDDDVNLTQPMVAPLDNVVDTNEVVADLLLRIRAISSLPSGGRITPGRNLCMLHESLLL